MFNSVLIANRGEIACRVIRACRDIGVKSVAIYSEPDEGAPHMLAADSAIPIGGESSGESYLSMEKVIAAARASKAEAIHPGYGFLSENPTFTKMCQEAGITFIGPSAEVMRTMGDKLHGRMSAQKANVPVLPGTDAPVSSADAKQYAEQIGYPLLVKARAGGGGMGIQTANNPEELAAALEGARSAGQHSFGDAAVYMERRIPSASHVEVQVFGDGKGNAIHMFERDCSVQRRKQKLIEETPCVKLPEEQLISMWEAAARLTASVNYAGAGTVEFLTTPGGQFFFIEMNARIQVEHPITEEVTGMDIVQMQIRLAAGEPVMIRQEDMARKGHAIEARILAEDPDTMLPEPGLITDYQPPAGEGVRVDSGIDKGTDVGLYYDPLMCKVIAYGKDRDEAIDRMKRALRGMRIVGVTTNTNLLTEILESDEFRTGKYDTNIVQTLRDKKEARNHRKLEEVAAIAAAIALAKRANQRVKPRGSDNGRNLWWEAGLKRQHARGW